MTRGCSTCDPTHIGDPMVLFEELARRRLLVAGPDLVVVMSNGAEVLGIAELPEDLEKDYGGEQVAAAAQRAGAGPWAPRLGPRHKTAHLVRRRTGRTVPLPHDLRGWTSWLNASNWMDCSVGEWFLVTDHGWRSLLSTRGPAAAQPRLRTLQVLPAS